MDNFEQLSWKLQRCVDPHSFSDQELADFQVTVQWTLHVGFVYYQPLFGLIRRVRDFTDDLLETINNVLRQYLSFAVSFIATPAKTFEFARYRIVIATCSEILSKSQSKFFKQCYVAEVYLEDIKLCT